MLVRITVLVTLAMVSSTRTVCAQDRFPAIDPGKASGLMGIKDTQLPRWARVLAPSLPTTTAKMLQLDYLHRARNPLGPRLSGQIRWHVADVTRCSFARKVAEADLLRAGMTEDDIQRLPEAGKGGPEEIRLAISFVRKLTEAAYKLTDEELETLVKHHGEVNVVSMVHTAAHGNFQQRIFLALGIDEKNDRPLPPIKVESLKEPPGMVAARDHWTSALEKTSKLVDFRPPWPRVKAEDLDLAMEAQKSRKPRIALPGEERFAKLPPALKGRAKRTLWGHVSLGYQPELTLGWFETMGSFQTESQLDLAFNNLFFWVVTRSNECFY